MRWLTWIQSPGPMERWNEGTIPESCHKTSRCLSVPLSLLLFSEAHKFKKKKILIGSQKERDLFSKERERLICPWETNIPWSPSHLQNQRIPSPRLLFFIILSKVAACSKIIFRGQKKNKVERAAEAGRMTFRLKNKYLFAVNNSTVSLQNKGFWHLWKHEKNRSDPKR